jgi:hypothetical protein
MASSDKLARACIPVAKQGRNKPKFSFYKRKVS